MNITIKRKLDDGAYDVYISIKMMERMQSIRLREYQMIPKYLLIRFNSMYNYV